MKQLNKLNILYDGYVTINVYSDDILMSKKTIHNSGTELLFQLIMDALTGEDIKIPEYIGLYENKDTIAKPCMSQKIKSHSIKISDEGIEYSFLIPSKATYNTICRYIVLSNESNIYNIESVAEILLSVDDSIQLDGRTNIEINWLLSFSNNQEGSEVYVSK